MTTATTPRLALSPPSLTATTSTRSMEVDTVVAAHGNMHFAAEKLGISVEELVTRLSEDDETLGRAVRAATLVMALDVVSDLAIALKVSLADMDPRDVGKTFTSLIAAIPALSSKPAVGTDSHDQHLTINQFNPETARGKLLDNILRAASTGPDLSHDGSAEAPVTASAAAEGPAAPQVDRGDSTAAGGDGPRADVRLGILGAPLPAGAESAMGGMDAAHGSRVWENTDGGGDASEVRERRAG